MNDPVLDRLDELSTNAHAAADPVDDLRRGKAALRRRRARSAALATTTLVTAGVAVAALNVSGRSGERPADSGGGASIMAVASDSAANLCMQDFLRADRVDRSPVPEPTAAPWEHPAVAPQLAQYRQVAAAILDPSSAHLEREVTNVQVTCDELDVRVVSLGTQLGWTTAGAVGVVRVEVIAPGRGDDAQIVMKHDRWAPTDNLPDGVTGAWVVHVRGGHAVYVHREDGLTVAVETNGVWGNNVAPGSAPARDIPSVGKLLQLAASEELTLPAS